MARRLNSLIASAPNRRKFVRNIGVAGVSGAALLVEPQSANAQSFSDIDLLNFALNLEYLQAELYTVATTGRTIDFLGVAVGGGTSESGATSGGAVLTFSTTDVTVQHVVQELAANERTHVSLLQNLITSLGGVFGNKPAVNLNALNFGFGGPLEFLQLARILKETSVSVYATLTPMLAGKWAAGHLTRILAAEAGHAGTLRMLLAGYGTNSALVADAVDVPTPSIESPIGTQYFATDANAQTAVRSPGEALYLLYNGGGLRSGGFFPSGVNGNSLLTTSSISAAQQTGAILSASPNPIPLTADTAYGSTTIHWSAPGAQYVQIRVGSPGGPLFTTNFATGSLRTKVWINDGMVLYLQDITNGKPLVAQNTLATLIMRTYAAA